MAALCLVPSISLTALSAQAASATQRPCKHRKVLSAFSTTSAPVAWRLSEARWHTMRIRAQSERTDSQESGPSSSGQPSTSTAIVQPEVDTSSQATASGSAAPDAEPKGNVGLAAASVLAAVGLFLVTRFGGGGPSLSALAATSIAYDEALSNGRPSVVEFYADWCEVCREMTADVFAVEQEYERSINFVMLNIDNPKWAPELDEFGVEGIPHFSFLDGQGNELGYVVGRLPRRILLENTESLASGKSSVPHSEVVGEFSSQSEKQSPRVIEPRTHG